MKWLRISNPGTFDVIGAVNMLGASVKVNDNPIGMFGSGTKFALAQAVRSDVDIKIYDGERMFNVGSAMKTFRDKTFLMVALNSVGKRAITPITTEFGAKDWNDDWFIFRELYSNALDEGTATLEVVNDASPTPNSTSIFLPYERFRTYYENLNKYFTKRERHEIWEGDGSVYRQGVYVGKLDGTTISFHCPYIDINECRVMDTYNTLTYVSSYLKTSDSEDVWKAFFKSTEKFKSELTMTVTDDAAYTAMHKALLSVYGEKYCICPKFDDIIRDVQSLGYVPVVLPTSIKVDSKLVQMYMNMNDTKVVRRMNKSEEDKYLKVRTKISAFIPMDIELDVKVFSEGLEGVLGDAKVGTNEIRIRDIMFDDEAKLMYAVIHEIGHIITKAGDYDRRFTSFFIDKLVELSM